MVYDVLPSSKPSLSLPTILSISELSSALKNTIEQNFNIVRVRGELSGVKLHSSGHLYFALKDNNALIDGICWRGTLSRLKNVTQTVPSKSSVDIKIPSAVPTPAPFFNPADGMEVICQGRLTTYGARSKYQIIVDHMEMAGIGALLKLLQDRKHKLAQEGLFDQDRKKPLPYIPRLIGLITSPTGAVLHDILHRIKDRFPCPIWFWPVVVQGENCTKDILAAIQGFNTIFDPAQKPDLLIIARGGGSFEDLWYFNDEDVVRAVVNSHIPIISAVGHETDTTLIDFASDFRAPTPTAAAEKAVPVRHDLLQSLGLKSHRLFQTVLRGLNHQKILLEACANRLISPQRQLENKIQLLDDRTDRLQASLPFTISQLSQKLNFLSHRLYTYPLKKRLTTNIQDLELQSNSLKKAWVHHLYRKQTALDYLKNLLESYSYKNTLKRGFTLLKGNDGKIISSIQDFKRQGQGILYFWDGQQEIAKFF